MTITDDELLALARKARDCYGGGAPWERYFAVVKDPSAIIALIERHRAEVERLTRERDLLKGGYDSACEMLNGSQQDWADEKKRAESALAAAQKRIAELDKAGRAVFEYFFGSIVCRQSRDADMEYELLSSLRAALAGKTDKESGT